MFLSHLYNMYTFILHLAPDECPDEYVDITIIGPTMEDMLVHKKGKLECHALENKKSIDKMYFTSEKGDEMLTSEKKLIDGNKKEHIISIDITYDEWSLGVKRICVVEHSETLDPLKKVYESDFGKKTILFEHESLNLLPLVTPSHK